MRSVDIVLSKEELKKRDKNPEAVAVVLDIIFATSSITAALETGVNRVLTAMDYDDALAISKQLAHDNWKIAGEKMAVSFPGCLSFEPLTIANASLKDQDLIYATTNGTVALRYTADFKRSYAASLRNGSAVVEHLLKNTDDDTDIVVVCSGANGHFNLEDFYGAGFIVNRLRALAPESSLLLSDLALVADLAFSNTEPLTVLKECQLAKMMIEMGLEDNINYLSQIDATDIVGVFDKGYVYGDKV